MLGDEIDPSWRVAAIHILQFPDRNDAEFLIILVQKNDIILRHVSPRLQAETTAH